MSALRVNLRAAPCKAADLVIVAAMVSSVLFISCALASRREVAFLQKKSVAATEVVRRNAASTELLICKHIHISLSQG